MLISPIENKQTGRVDSLLLDAQCFGDQKFLERIKTVIESGGKVLVDDGSKRPFTFSFIGDGKGNRCQS